MNQPNNIFSHKFSSKSSENSPNVKSIKITEWMMRVIFANSRTHTESNEDGTFTHTVMPRTEDYNTLENDVLD